jgi:hypothetical protein
MPLRPVSLVARPQVSLSLHRPRGPSRALHHAGPDYASSVRKFNRDRTITDLVYNHPKRVTVGLFRRPTVLQPKLLWV